MKYELLSFLERGRGKNWGRKLVRPRAEAGQTTKLLICLSEARGGGGGKNFRQVELRSGNIVPIIRRDASASSTKLEKYFSSSSSFFFLLLLLRFSNLIGI